MITNDSGPLHIAEWYGTKIVAFFGPETPVIYGPRSKDALVFYLKDKYCSPCINVYDNKKSLYGDICKDNKCLSEIKPIEVFEKTEERFLLSGLNTW